MKDLLKSGLLVVACACASSCWVPEEFKATLAIDESWQYEFVYDGTIAYGPALGQIKERGQLSSGEEAELGQAVSELRTSPGMISADYVGRGRFRIRFREAGPVQAGKKLFLDVIEFRADPNGGIRISGPEIPPDVQQEFSSVGLKFDGIIRLTSKVPVVEHNAASTPWFGGLFGSYKWHVTAVQAEMPTVLLR